MIDVQEHSVDENELLTTINEYINKSFKSSEKEEELIKNLENLATFLDKLNHSYSPNIFIRLIETNSKLSKLIERIVQNDFIYIQEHGLEYICDSNSIISLIEAYCIIHEIEYKECPSIKKEYEVDDNIFYECDEKDLQSSLKMYLNEISKKPLLTYEEERELLLKMKQGDEQARETLIERNLRLVVKFAKKYSVFCTRLSLLDLIQEGNLGLIKAIDEFDISRNTKLSTYAVLWIKQSILRSIENKERFIRLPVYKNRDYNNFKNVYNKLQISLGRDPTITEIQEQLNISTEEIKKIYRLSALDPVSLNSAITDSKNSETKELEYFVADNKPTPEDILIDKMFKEEVLNLLKNSNLKEREQQIIILRFGLNEKKPMTLEEVGNIFGLTRERIRQIENKTLRKLRRSPYLAGFIDYMSDPEKAKQIIEENKDKKPKREVSRKKEEEKMPRKLISIYCLFDKKGYSKEEVEEVLKKLTDKRDWDLLRKRYGDDLENPVSSKEFSQQDKNEFYSSLVPKIQQSLEKQRNGQKDSPNNHEDESVINITPIESTGKPNATSMTKSNINNKQSDNSYNPNEDINKLLQIINTPMFREIYKEVSWEEAIVAGLMLGGFKERYYEPKAIATFLGIEVEDVAIATQNVLDKYTKALTDTFKESLTTVFQKVKKPNNNTSTIK